LRSVAIERACNNGQAESASIGEAMGRLAAYTTVPAPLTAVEAMPSTRSNSPMFTSLMWPFTGAA
jgi:hypothetical protein